MEDDLMRLFANAGPLSTMLDKAMVEGEPLEHGLLNYSIQQAQKKVEAQNYSIRKRLLQYDDVLNRQREVVYGLRNEAIKGEHPKDAVFEVVAEELRSRADALATAGHTPEAAAITSFLLWVNLRFPLSLKAEDARGKSAEEIVAWVLENLQKAYAQRSELETPEAMIGLERYVLIRAIDRNWQDHLTEIEDLRKSVGLRGYGQRDPLNEYKSEAFTYFEQMMGRIREDVCSGLFTSATNLQSFQSLLDMMKRARATGPTDPSQPIAATAAATVTSGTATRPPASAQLPPPASAGSGAQEVKLPKVAPRPAPEAPKFGRNDMVTVRRGVETQQVKFKKAEQLIKEGWTIVPEK
jgi:preprotein translocase subunit SecA